MVYGSFFVSGIISISLILLYNVSNCEMYLLESCEFLQLYYLVNQRIVIYLIINKIRDGLNLYLGIFF